MYEVRVWHNFLGHGEPVEKIVLNNRELARELIYKTAVDFEAEKRASYSIQLYQDGSFAGLSISR